MMLVITLRLSTFCDMAMMRCDMSMFMLVATRRSGTRGGVTRMVAVAT